MFVVVHGATRADRIPPDLLSTIAITKRRPSTSVRPERVGT